MHIIIGSDKSGLNLKEAIKAHLIENGHKVDDLGTKDMENAQPYYVVASAVGKAISEGKAEKAILVCGTGMGMAQVSGKYPGVRSACVESVYGAKMCRSINDSNILCMGGWIIADTMGIQMVDAFLGTEFTQDMEEWRKEFLTKARSEFSRIEDGIYR
jgi:ribose 5-phosphate isomerase B